MELHSHAGKLRKVECECVITGIPAHSKHFDRCSLPLRLCCFRQLFSCIYPHLQRLAVGEEFPQVEASLAEDLLSLGVELEGLINVVSAGDDVIHIRGLE